ncbi:hypothetical protein BGZ94_004942 [Podila epigama]|nr:hypothetical protein BGZ94_004942 [Podila epigama]
MNAVFDDTAKKEIRRKFLRDGFVVVQNVLRPEDIGILSREADNLMNFVMSEGMDIMEILGGVIEPISCGYIDPPMSQMYILSKKSYSGLRDLVTEEPDSVTNILFSIMPTCAQTLLPDQDPDSPLCLFNEQYIVKTPKSEKISQFAWHQNNGTLIVEPYPLLVADGETGHRELSTTLSAVEDYLAYHRGISSLYGPSLDRDKALQLTRGQPVNEPIVSEPPKGYIEHFDPSMWDAQQRPPVLIQVPAGSVVFLSGFVRHCSLGNGSSKFRRAFMPQYSIGKVLNAEGGYISLAVPCSD